MLDLVDLLKNNEQSTTQEQKLTSVLFHQSEECKELVEEAFRFEGIVTPATLENSDDTIRKHVRESTIEIVLVELNMSSDVTADMKRISHLLPNHASVIVIGSEDAISTIRNLKEMGFYYLFWPVSKQELIDFVRNVNDNRTRNSGLGQNRTAKRIAIWGAKGGVGATFLACEIAFVLSAKKNSSCLLIDHNYSGGNLDVFLGLSQFEKRPVTPGSMSSSLDLSYATSMTKKVNNMLSVLAIDSDELIETELKDYSRTLSKELAVQKNFIIEDLSSSANSRSDLKYLATACDVLVLTLEPTVSSLRDAARVISELDKHRATVRCIVVLNYTVPEKSATVSIEEIEKYLQQAIDIVCPFEPNLGAMILKGKHLYQQNHPISQSVNRLTSLLLGQNSPKSKMNIFQRLARKR